MTDISQYRYYAVLIRDYLVYLQKKILNNIYNSHMDVQAFFIFRGEKRGFKNIIHFFNLEGTVHYYKFFF